MQRVWSVLGSVGLLFAVLVAPTLQEKTCQVTIHLVDGETEQPLAGWISISRQDSGELLHPEELISRGVGLPKDHPVAGWFVVSEGRAMISLPAVKLTIAAIAGLETERVEQTVDFRGKETAEVKLTLPRFSHLRQQDVYSGNTHLHLMKLNRETADRYLREIPRADGLDVLFLSYLERAGADHDYISNRYTQRDLELLSQDNLPIGHGEEHRHNFGSGGQGYGHVMLLNLPELVLPVSLGPGIMKQGSDGIPIQRGIDQARKAGATAVWCHNHWGLENLSNWVAGRLDAQNIFDGGEHGSYEDSFYRYLNAGLQVPFSTGTDWFLYDFSRVYVPLKTPLTPQNWLAALKAGRSFITNGPLLELTVEGAQIGDRLEMQKPGEVTVTAHGIGRIDYQRLELVWNGRVIRQTPSRAVQGHFESDLKATVTIDQPGWIALRTPPPPLAKEPDRYPPVGLNEFGQPLFSHTSPIYVSVGGQKQFDVATAKDLLSDIEKSWTFISENANFADEQERQVIHDVYENARETLQWWIADHQSEPR